MPRSKHPFHGTTDTHFCLHLGRCQRHIGEAAMIIVPLTKHQKQRGRILHALDTSTDAQLLDRFVTSHETAAFESLVRRHGPMVLRVCQRVLNSAPDAEDAFQATFIVLMRKAGAIAHRESLGSWLYGAAYRIALKARSQAAVRHVRELGINPSALENCQQ